MRERVRFFTKKSGHKYDKDPATVCSTAVNSGIRSISPRLASRMSVEAIVRTIRRRGIVHRLYLGNSCLGDSGCVRLFDFLNSPAGRPCRESLTELFLTQNDIGPHGLLAVAGFMKDNTVLRELCLSGNPLTRDADVIREFVTSLNSSRLCTLQLLHSNSLSDPFVQAFLPGLTTPYLRQLDMSAINMTRAVVPIIVDYVRSPRCHLERLQCNANSLSLLGARSIIDAIKKSNHTLGKVNVDDQHMDEHGGGAEERAIAWQEGWRILSSATRRNSGSRITVKTEATALLRYCRALYLRSGQRESLNPPQPASLFSRESLRYQKSCLFFKLPFEIHLEILTFLAPALSYQQLVRVVRYAADITSLPRVGHEPMVKHGGSKAIVARDRVSAVERQPFEGSWRPPEWWECHCFSFNCSALRRWKRERRDIWLTEVGCDTWESGY
ncbi:hypothetical protein EDD16DRAFT_1561942 [Pisolithus croceorrhizus]|nr:hypothetical protein EDD16DRAFT_1561942 [Pisolithus croceorrhizus]KAI6129488.1 hypothetical protein EV401DRAFT_2054592 [Pisolithus croceorrhizus]